MISMKDKSEIIRLHEHQGLSEREIHRRLGFSRKTIHKCLVEYSSALRQQEKSPEVLQDYILSPPKYNNSNRSKKILTPQTIEAIDACLHENFRKIKTGLKKQCMLKQDIYDYLIKMGIEISYSSVCKYIRSVEKKKHEEGFIKQRYLPAENCEFDWGEVKLCITGKWQKIQLSVFTLAYSNTRYAELFHRQNTLAYMESHVNFIRFNKGVPHRMVYDNMRVAVGSFAGSEKKPTDALSSMSCYYGFDYRFCNFHRGNEKGHVERSVEVIRRKAFSLKDHFDSLKEANEYLIKVCEKLNSQEEKANRFAQERLLFLPLKDDMGCFERRTMKVDKYSTITLDSTHYSVPDTLVGRVIDVKLFSEKIQLFEGSVFLGEHARTYSTSWVLNIEHYLRTLQRKPGALTNSLALWQAPPQLKEIYERHFFLEGKSFIELLLFAKENKIDYQTLYQTCQQAEKSGVQKVTTDHIRALLDSNTQAKSINKPSVGKDETTHFATLQLKKIAQLFNHSTV